MGGGGLNLRTAFPKGTLVAEKYIKNHEKALKMIVFYEKSYELFTKLDCPWCAIVHGTDMQIPRAGTLLRWWYSADFSEKQSFSMFFHGF